MIKLQDKSNNVKLFNRAVNVQFRDRASIVKMKYTGEGNDFFMRDNSGVILQDNNSVDLTDNR